MFVTGLNHYLVRTRDLEASRAFYEQVLGLVPGRRPDFPFPGYWMYAGDQPLVHLAGPSGATDAPVGGAGGPTLAQAPGTAPPATGAVDHIGFSAHDRRGFVERLRSMGLAHVLRNPPGGELLQVFVDDPDGVRIEMNYLAATERALERDRGLDFHPDRV